MTPEISQIVGTGFALVLFIIIFCGWLKDRAAARKGKRLSTYKEEPKA